MIKVSAPSLKTIAGRLQNLSKMPARDFKRIMVSTQRGTFTETKRAAVTYYGVNQKRVAEDIKVSTVKAAPVSFTITGDRTPISLRHYSQQGGKSSGLSFIVLRERGRKRFAGAFKAISNNASLVWARTGERRVMTKGRYRGKMREAIEPLFGPSVPDMLKNKAVFDRVEIYALTKMSSELDRSINRILRSRG